jgi:hypothetical protein
MVKEPCDPNCSYLTIISAGKYSSAIAYCEGGDNFQKITALPVASDQRPEKESLTLVECVSPKSK